jgi:GntR family transcriptional regulator, transcriptional repressor for pyruvate dehydrogenase complex
MKNDSAETNARRIASGIQSIIRTRRISPGGRLPTEHALARRFGVSRPVVREAIQALKTLGIVESRPKVGLRVLPFDPGFHFDQMIPRIHTDEERAELYEFRRLLEPAVLRLAASRATQQELESLENIVQSPLPRGRAAIREGLARDVAFHEGLWRLAGNRFVWSLRGLLLRYFADVERTASGPAAEAAMHRTNAQHLAIVRALKAGDAERAARTLARNLDAFRPSRSSHRRGGKR